jgi:POT family proton-dependent oligopeptide transporter
MKHIRSKAVTFIALTQMWESFSFFGMRALLVLFLIAELGYSPKSAFILYTLYIAFVKVFGALGGLAVDRFLGCKRAVVIGGVFIMFGHCLLAFCYIQQLFFLALGSIIWGSALFRVSLQTLLGSFYGKEDTRRDKGFTFLYVGMNLGGLLAAVICGFVANIYGWHAGFGLAAFGMMISMAIFLSKIALFNRVRIEKPISLFIALPASGIALIGIAFLLSNFKMTHVFALPIGLIALGALLYTLSKKMSRASALLVTGSLGLLVFYFTAEELWGSLLMIFSETHINRTLLGVEIPSAVVAAINPFTIILLGPLVAKLDVPRIVKFAIAFVFLSLAFFILYVASLVLHPSILYLIFGLSFIAMGELFLAPNVYSLASKEAPQECGGMMMGATTLAFSMGTLLSGEVAKISFNPTITFLLIGLVAGGIATFLFLYFFKRRFIENYI